MGGDADDDADEPVGGGMAGCCGIKSDAAVGGGVAGCFGIKSECAVGGGVSGCCGISRGRFLGATPVNTSRVVVCYVLFVCCLSCLCLLCLFCVCLCFPLLFCCMWYIYIYIYILLFVFIYLYLFIIYYIYIDTSSHTMSGSHSMRCPGWYHPDNGGSTHSASFRRTTCPSLSRSTVQPPSPMSFMPKPSGFPRTKRSPSNKLLIINN